MLRAAPSVQARLLMLIMWRAGLRVSEALALVRADLSLDDKAPALRVRQGKGNRPRMVPVHLELAAALSNALGFMPGGQDQRIVPTTRRSALRWVTAAQAQLEGAGLLQPGRVVGNHTFRHSAARHWLASGVPINHVQRWLGHASLQTTLIYLTILPDPAGLMDRVP
jgi:integrase